MPFPQHIQDMIRENSKDAAAYEQLIKLFDQQLTEQADEFRQRFDNHNAIQLLIELETGRIADANQAAVAFYGYTVDELKSMTVRHLNIMSREEVEREIDIARIQNRTYLKFRHRLASGEIRDIQVFSSPLSTSEGRFHHSIIVDVTDQYKLESRYLSLFEQSNDAVYIVDLNGKKLLYNQQAAEMLGYSYNEFAQTTSLDMIAQDEQHKVDNILKRLLSGEDVPPYERVYRHKNGSVIIGEINAQVIYDKDNNPLHIQSIVRDVTHRRQMEQTTQAFLDDMKALQEVHLELGSIQNLDDLYRRMIDLSHERLGFERIALFRIEEIDKLEYIVGTFGTDADGNIRDERDFRDVIKAGHWTIVVRDSPDHTQVWLDGNLYENYEIAGTGWKVASTLWTGSASIGYLICDNLVTGRDPRPYESELVSLLATTYGHLIERLEAEKVLYDATISLQEMANAGSTGLWEWNLQTNEVKYSAVWKRLIGFEEHEFEDKHENFLARVHPDDFGDLQDAIEVTIAKHLKNVSVEFRMRHKDGTYRWILSQGSIYTDSNNQPVRLLGTHIDITDHKLSQARDFEYALEKERLRLLSDFIQDAAHEFRTPLSTINSNVFLIRSSEDKDYRAVKSKQIAHQVSRIQRLVDMLLMMSKLEAHGELQFVSVDMSSILTALCDSMQSKYGGMPLLTVTIAPNLPRILGDVGYLSEALKQLLDNAYHFTPDDGEITIKANTDNDMLLIEVSDSGAGIPEDSLPFIFDTFWRYDVAHSTPGFGLGLPIAKKIIDEHGGTITAKSHEGEGSCFYITLPGENF